MVSRQGILSAPNQSFIQGQILNIENGPEGIGHAWRVKVIKSENVIGYANFAHRHLGKEIIILIHPEMKKVFNVGDKIIARIFFQGDERGGAFFLIGDKIEKL